MKILAVLLIFAFITGCKSSGTANKGQMTSVGKSVQKTGKTNASALSAIGSNNGVTRSTVVASTDNIIEFKNSPTGNMVCTYPSGFCKTDATESTGGARLTGSIPNSSNSFLHYMKFRFYSKGYFKVNPEGHMAFGLRGQAYRVEDVGQSKAGADGRGMIIGHIGEGYSYNKNNPACVHRMAQIESWYKTSHNNGKSPNQSNIFPQTCSDSIFEDYKWYSVQLEVTSHHYVVMKIFNEANQLIYKTYYNDLPNKLDGHLTGWFIAHVFENNSEPWSVRLENFEVGHVVDPDVFYPVKDFAPALYFSTRHGVVNPQSANDFSVILSKSTPSVIKLNNINNRSRIFGCLSSRSSKNGRDSVDCSLWTNYRAMNLNAENDWVYSGNTFSLKESFLKTVPPGFYTMNTRDNPQSDITQISLSFELRENDSGIATPATATSTAYQSFCNNSTNTKVYFACAVPRPDKTWVDVSGGCFHKGSSDRCN